MPTTEQQRRASVFEIVGAWLHIWTPPRDARVPPIPWRKLGIGAAIGALLLGAALAVMIPRINDTKERNAAQFRAQRERAAATNRARITRSQTPRHGAAANLMPAAGANVGEELAARARLVSRVETDILVDARARAARGEMRPVIGPTSCERTPGSPAEGEIGVFDCFVVTRKIKATERNPAGALGYPFRAIVDYKDYTYTWCKIEQVPGEMLVLAPDDVTLLPAACRGPKA